MKVPFEVTPSSGAEINRHFTLLMFNYKLALKYEDINFLPEECKVKLNVNLREKY